MKPLDSTPVDEERRRAERHPLQVVVSVRKKNGETIAARSVNISSSGILVQVEQPLQFQLGEEVTVEVDLPDQPATALAVWGIGRIVRVDALLSAIQLDAGSFQDLHSRDLHLWDLHSRDLHSRDLHLGNLHAHADGNPDSTDVLKGRR